MSGEHILVVDDDANMRQFFGETVLKLEGYTVTTATDGDDALRKAIENSPDLVITDLAMPNMDGLELAEALRKAGYRVPVILMTAEGSEEIAARALRSGVMDYFIKPFEVEDMLDSVVRVLNATRTGGLRADVVDQRHMQTVNTLIGIGKTITSLLDLDLIINRVIEAAVYLTDAEEAVLMLRDGETLYIHAAKNIPTDYINGTVSLSEGPASRVMKTVQPIIAAEPQEIIPGYKVKSLCYVPIVIQGEPVGILGLHNRTLDQPITPRENSAITALAEFTAIAIHNARLYHNTEEGRQRLERIFERLPDPTFLISQEQRVMMSNPAAQELFAHVPAIDGLKPEEFIDDQDLKKLIHQGVENAAATAEITLENGRIFDTHVGQVAGLGTLVVLQEITHLKEMDRIKSEVIATMSHDLRSPLTSILSYVELMSRVGDLNEQQTAFAKEVGKSVRLITSLIDDMMAMQKQEGGLYYRRQPVYLSKIVRKVHEDMHPKAALKNQQFNFDVVEGECPILGNEIRLRQSVTNLVDNAIKYTPESGEVSMTIVTEDDQTLLIVKDTGIGISAEAQADVFNKFYRAPEVAGSHEGTGLGLHLVASIIEAHDGRIWVESTPGQGSVFTVMLPIVLEEAADV